MLGGGSQHHLRLAPAYLNIFRSLHQLTLQALSTYSILDTQGAALDSRQGRVVRRCGETTFSGHRPDEVSRLGSPLGGLERPHRSALYLTLSRRIERRENGRAARRLRLEEPSLPASALLVSFLFVSPSDVLLTSLVERTCAHVRRSKELCARRCANETEM